MIKYIIFGIMYYLASIIIFDVIIMNQLQQQQINNIMCDEYKDMFGGDIFIYFFCS